MGTTASGRRRGSAFCSIQEWQTFNLRSFPLIHPHPNLLPSREKGPEPARGTTEEPPLHPSREPPRLVRPSGVRRSGKLLIPFRFVPFCSIPIVEMGRWGQGCEVCRVAFFARASRCWGFTFHPHANLDSSLRWNDGDRGQGCEVPVCTGTTEGGLNLGPIWPWLASFTPTGEAGNGAGVASVGTPLTGTHWASVTSAGLGWPRCASRAGMRGSPPSRERRKSRRYTQAGNLRVWYDREECVGVANF